MRTAIGLLVATVLLFAARSVHGQVEGIVHARCKYDGTISLGGSNLAVKGLLFFDESNNNETYCFYLLKTTKFKYKSTSGGKDAITVCAEEVQKNDPSFTCAVGGRPMDPKVAAKFMSVYQSDQIFFGNIGSRKLIIDGRYWKSRTRWRNTNGVTHGRIFPGPPFSASTSKAYSQVSSPENNAPSSFRITGATTARIEGNNPATYKNWIMCQTCAEVYSWFPTSVKGPTVPTTPTPSPPTSVPPPTTPPPPVTDCPQAICDICVMPEN